MSPLRLRRMLRRPRRRAAVLLAVLALFGTVAVHHVMPMDMHAMPAGAVCLAVLGAAAVIAAAHVLTRPQVRAWTRARDWPLRERPVLAPQTVPARAGPLFLRLSVLRR